MTTKTTRIAPHSIRLYKNTIATEYDRLIDVIDKQIDAPPPVEFCQAMWGVSSIEELRERAQKGD